MITLIQANSSDFFSDAATREAPQGRTSTFSSQNETQKAIQYAKTLQSALDAGMKFPVVETVFEPIEVYRIIDYTAKPAPLSREHFNSQVEDGILPKYEKGAWKLYSCSCFKSYDEVTCKLALSKYFEHDTLISKGMLVASGGSLKQDANPDTSHVHWFLYNEYDPSKDNFEG